MHVSIALYGAARVVVGQPLVDLSFDIPTITLGQVLEKMIATYPRARPYLLDETGSLPSYMRVLINNVRPNPDDSGARCGCKSPRPSRCRLPRIPDAA